MREDYRNLPPVEPVKPPSRFSMTTLQRADQCPRAAYLGVKYRNGPSSHEMDRGTLAHAAVERLMKDLIVSGEPALSPDDPTQAAAMTAAIVDEVLRERPDLVVPRAEVDNVRQMLFHVACCYDVDPETIAGLELLMVLDLDCGWTISGRLDLVALPSPSLGYVDDYKSGRAMRSQEEYETSVQPNLYAVLLLFGTPVVVTDCWHCSADGRLYDDAGVVHPCDVCDGKGYTEQRGEPFGLHLQGVQTREIYPHAKPRDDGTLHRREMLLARTLVADYRADLERMAQTLGERFGTEYERCRSCMGEPTMRCTECGSYDCYPGHEDAYFLGEGMASCTGCGAPDKAPTLHIAVPCPTCEGRGVITNGTWDFPARAGSWCSMCPASAECPLPEHLRDHAGTINTVEQASEAWEKTLVVKAQLAAIEREVKTFCKAHGLAIQVGDERWEWEPTEGRAVKRNGRSSDWDGLQAAVAEAVEFGTPFEIGEWVKPTNGTTFKRTKVGTGESR